MTAGADPMMAIQRAFINAMKTDATIAGIVGARVYPPDAPAQTAWPFIRYGHPIMTPDEAAGWIGGEVRATVHVFAQDTDHAEVAGRLARRIGRLLDDADLTLTADPDDGGIAHCIDITHVGTQMLPDGADTSRTHAVIEFDVQAGEER